MYVCLCNAVTDRQIRSQSECTRGTVAEVYRALGIKVKCGKCVRTAKCIIAEMHPDACAATPACAMTDNRIDTMQPEVRSGVSFPALAMTGHRMNGRQPEARNTAPVPVFAMAD
jgi:bacterioferritin-associated ferredoxin